MLIQQAVFFGVGARLILRPLRSPVSFSGSLHSGDVATEHMIRIAKPGPQMSAFLPLSVAIITFALFMNKVH